MKPKKVKKSAKRKASDGTPVKSKKAKGAATGTPKKAKKEEKEEEKWKW